MPIHLYAEHLVNIRTLSLQASLSTVSNKETRATLSSDGSLLTLSHEGETATIKLPISIPGGHNAATLTLPAAPTRDLSFRVSLSEKEGSELLTCSSTEDTIVVPWTAVSLTSETEITCKSCHSVILERGKISVWKDLPSKNWAEMMDFWHCHRPDVPNDGIHTAPKKGYAANSRLALEPGIAMVDPVDFVFFVSDCQNLTVVPSNHPTADERLQCNSCQTFIGHVNDSKEGYTLRKLHLSLSNSASSKFVSYNIDKWLACHLLSSVESQGVRKFTVQSVDAPETAAKVWIFTPDTTISSSAAQGPDPIRMIKVLWIDLGVFPKKTGTLTRQTLSEGELELQHDEMTWLRQCLLQSAALLPESGRKFQSWQVALLPRFSLADVDYEHFDQRPTVQLPEVPDLQTKEMLSELLT